MVGFVRAWNKSIWVLFGLGLFFILEGILKSFQKFSSWERFVSLTYHRLVCAVCAGKQCRNVRVGNMVVLKQVQNP